MKYLYLIKYLLKVFLRSPMQLFKEIQTDLKKDLNCHKFKSKHKKVLIFGLPKSGTTLVEEILEQLPYVRLNRTPVRFYIQPNLKDSHTINNESFKFFSEKKYSFIKTHTYFDTKHIDLVKKHNAKILICFRDIRDVMISRYNHVLADKKHWQHKEIINLPTNEGFLKSLTSLNNSPPENKIAPIEDYYNWVYNWLSFKDIKNYNILWYEEYLKDPISYINKILNDLDFTEFDAKVIENKLATLRKNDEHTKLKNKLLRVGKNVSTFREGKSGDWKNFFDDNTYKKFISYIPGPIEKVIQN